MQLININKARYNRHLKIIFAACAIGLAIGSLAISQLLIAFFPDVSGSHFHWNVLGVIVSALVIAYSLNRYRAHDFMTEVVYVWRLKQALNKIHRKTPALQAASLKGDTHAVLILHYSYAGSRLLWELDNNTLTMDELELKQAELDRLAEKYQCVPNVVDYKESLLRLF